MSAMLSVLPRLPCCTTALPALKPSPVRQPARRFFAAALAAGAIPWASVRWHQQGQRHLHTECQGNVCFNRLQIEFCGRPPKGYTPIYYADAETNTASVNAGDYNLYVGGGSINLAFAKELGLNPASNDYKQMHKALLKAAAATPGSLVRGVDVPAADSLREKLGLLGCYARVHESRPKGDLNPVGAAFLDIFGTLRPLSQKNVAMLYVVGPKGTGAPGGHGPTVDSKAQFLAAVEEMAMNALATVAAYNAEIKEQQKEMPSVETLQVCLVSGGVYMHPDSSKKDVAKAILRGFQRGGNISDLPVVRFAYDSNCFEDAVAEATPTSA